MDTEVSALKKWFGGLLHIYVYVFHHVLVLGQPGPVNADA